MSFGCFETEEIEIFEQEGIDYFKKDAQFIIDYKSKIESIDLSKKNSNIPLVTQQIYLTNPSSPKKMDDISIEKTVRSINLLNNFSSSFKHFIWVNSFDIVPEEIRKLSGVEIHFIAELANLEIWGPLSEMLDGAGLTSSIFAKASDLIRYSVLYLYGGLYRDLDYEIYKPEEFVKLLNNFDLFVGKEFDDHEPVYVGSALVASIAKHPVIEKALELLQRNLISKVEQLPEYLQYPCDKLNHQIYQTGPAVITMAFFLAANQVGYNDVLLPPNILYNWEYAKASTPKSPCHVPGKTVEPNPITIGADMFCGNWHKTNERYYYKRNVDNYLYFAAQNNDVGMAKRSISDGADVNKVFSSTGATPLYIAAQNGNFEIVKLLVENGVDVNKVIFTGKSPLRAAAEENNIKIVELLLEESAFLALSDNARDSLIKKVKSLGNKEMENLFKQQKKKNNLLAYDINCFKVLNDELFALEDINYKIKEEELRENYFEKIRNFTSYLVNQRNAIPKISHQIFITAKSKTFDDISLNKIKRNIEGLLEVNKDWKFFFWTNDPSSIPDSIKNLQNVEIHLIEELSQTILYEDIVKLIRVGSVSSFTESSNLIRYTIIKIFGGIYYDLDYEIYNFNRLLQYSNSFNFLAGKEFDKELSQIGNSFIAAVANHPIIEQAIEWVKRNFAKNEDLPEYLKHSCTIFSTRMFRSGPSLLTLAVYKKANSLGYDDFIDMTSRSFFNIEYAHHTTIGSSCYKNNPNASLVTIVNGTEIETIGSDMLCGAWTPKNYFDSIFYPENIEAYLYLASQDGNLAAVGSYLEYGVDVNKILPQTGVTPLFMAVQNGNVAVAKKLIAAGASIWFRTKDNRSIKTASLLSENQEMIDLINDEYRKLLENTELECFQGDIDDVFIQENINYKIENKKLEESAEEKFSNIEKYLNLNKNPINKVTHQIYVSFDIKEISEILKEKTKVSLDRLNDFDQDWNHFIWTNNASIIPQELLDIKGVKIRNIYELKDNKYFYIIEHLLKLSQDDKLFLNQVSDVLRLIILLQEGGVYRDFDFEIYRAKELEELLQAFNFVAGKERYAEVSYVGNAFIAAKENHPIIATALQDYIKRNFKLNKDLLPLYLQYPCNKTVKVIYETGSPVITSSYFKSANQDGNFDLIMPANVFYNIKYAWKNTPKSRCYSPDKTASLDEIIDGKLVKTIGSDLFCGSWPSLDLIEYPGKEYIYLYMAAQRGDFNNVKRLLDNGASPDSFLKSNNVTSLAIAAQNGFFDIVKLLVEKGADVNFNKDGYTAIYRAIQEEKYEITQYLLDNSADIDYVQANGVTPLFYAAYKNWPKMVNLLIKNKANQEIKFKDETPYEYALRRGYDEVVKEFKQQFRIEIDQFYNDEILEKFIGNIDNYFPGEI